MKNVPVHIKIGGGGGRGGEGRGRGGGGGGKKTPICRRSTAERNVDADIRSVQPWGGRWVWERGLPTVSTGFLPSPLTICIANNNLIILKLFV